MAAHWVGTWEKIFKYPSVFKEGSVEISEEQSFEALILQQP